MKSDPTAERAARYTAYRQIPGTPVIAYAVGSLNDILAPWWRGVAIQGLGLVTFAVYFIEWPHLLYATASNVSRRRIAITQARLERLAAASATIFALRDRDAVLKRATDMARETHSQPSGCDKLQNRQCHWRAKYSHRLFVEEIRRLACTYTDTPDGSGIYRIITETNQVMRMTQTELENHPAWKGFGAAKEKHPPMRGWLAAPLKDVGAGENFGMIQMSDRNEGEYDAADEAILVQLANVISIALDALAPCRKGRCIGCANG